jgi:hypothetical protein
MKVICTQEQNLAGIPSASAIELVGENLIIFGDDARSLYMLNRARQLAQVVPLPGIAPGQSHRIPKHEKPDIESAFSYFSAGETHVIALGSGSSGTARDGGLHGRIDSRGAIRIDELALGALYNNLRQAPEIGHSAVLNIEGAAITDEHVILAQRAAGCSGNFLLRFERAAFLSWLENCTPLPVAEFVPVSLVSVSGVEAGLTGLAFSLVHRRLFFTAAVEVRNDPVQDGAVLGSFIGSFSWHAQQQLTLENCEVPENLPATRKLESICLLHENDGLVQALAVSDDDMGSSQLAGIRISLP